MIRNTNHIPVLLQEVIRVLDPKPGEFFVDGTVGLGGHAAVILEQIGEHGTFLGVDADREAVTNLKSKISEVLKFEIRSSNFRLVHASYSEIPDILKRERLQAIDGLLLDLGFSSAHVDDPERGFSFRNDGPLDMRYDTRAGLTAAEIINSFSKDKIEVILKTLGDERFAGRIASEIVAARRLTKITRTSQLAGIVRMAIPAKFRRGSIDPATRTFQAFRIFVNKELEHLQEILAKIPTIMKSGGRVAIISFHSLEDRIVKNSFRDFVKNGNAEFITKKPIIPSRLEQKSNPRSRSAKLRAIKIIKTNNL